MPASPVLSRTTFHVRSVTLPSRPPPIAVLFQEYLCILRSGNDSTSSSSSSSSVSKKLGTLTDLYGCVDELLLSPVSRQNVAQQCQAKWLDKMLDRSVRLFDVYGAVRDGLLQTRECIQDIQSSLRRKCSGPLSMYDEIDGYLRTRREVRKTIQKCLRSMKKVDNDDRLNPAVSMLRDVEHVTADVFKSLLIHIAGTKAESRNRSWFMVSKIDDQKDEKEAAAAATGEFEDLDSAMISLMSQKKKTSINMMQVDSLRNQIKKLETEIQELDEALECFFRHMIKTRTTLLNILSN